MLKHRIIPVLLTDGNGQCVKPVSFERPYRKLGTMEQYINTMESRDIDELIIIDINATQEGRKPNYEKLRSWCNNLFCPVTYGGGISSLDDIRLALKNGADKVAIGHSALKLEFIDEASGKFGAQAITGIVNYNEKSIWSKYSYKHLSYAPASNYAELLEEAGCGEILLVSTKIDGTMEGYDLYTLRETAHMLNIPIVALGGCADPSHMAQALDAGASAVAAGSMFLYTDWTPKSCARYLSDRGYAVRV